MNPDFEVDTEELRRAAAALRSTAAGVGGSTGRAPRSEITPRWHTADAALLAAAAARQQLAQLGEDLAETARRITTAAAAYEQADARATTRFRLSR
jgi:Excreted virulence factor EspC, type VII ESX diderm